jgi:acetyl-CoA carboxylase biotin carboxylase subunit
LRAPGGPGIRDDSGAFEGWTVPTAYDPLVSKVIAWAPDRAGAISRMVRALTEYDLRGISTTIGFCRELIQSPSFAAGEFDTTSVDRLLEHRPQTPVRDDVTEEIAAIAAALWEMAQTPVAQAPVAQASVAQASVAQASVAQDFSPATTETAPSAFRRTKSESLWAQRARLEHLR